MIEISTRVNIASVARRIYIGGTRIRGRIVEYDNLIYAEDGQSTGNMRDNTSSLVIAATAVREISDEVYRKAKTR